mmetsp:Transcript_258/g.879  ORF Transcript_258/g.879 Transcript_258/m.879 type:complete len:99 (+) Transcript_258:980-1276(+)
MELLCCVVLVRLDRGEQCPTDGHSSRSQQTEQHAGRVAGFGGLSLLEACVCAWCSSATAHAKKMTFGGSSNTSPLPAVWPCECPVSSFNAHRGLILCG